MSCRGSPGQSLGSFVKGIKNIMESTKSCKPWVNV